MTVPVLPVELLDGVGAWFTGRPDDDPAPAVGRAGNLSHRRPHLPRRLAADRAEVCQRLGLATDDLHWMRQVHGADVGVVGPTTPAGAELRDVDALVTEVPGRALVVQVADCVPVLLASTAGPVAAVHAGRRGMAAGVVQATLDRLSALGATPDTLSAVVGPAIGGCCYEVPQDLHDEVAGDHPEASARTTWGTPSLDLPAAVAGILRRGGVGNVASAGSCTRCGSGWFSHRADPDAGRQVGIVVRRPLPS